MIHQLIFASPKPGMSEADFQNYWVTVHGPRYAAKIRQIVQYCVDTRVPDAVSGTNADAGVPWGGVAEIWLASEEAQLASLQSKEYLDGARLDEPNWAAFWQTLALDTDAHVLRDRGPHRADQPGVKLFILGKRAAGMSLEEFRDRSLATVGPILGGLPNLKGYVQGHTRDAAYTVGEAPLDSVHQLAFDDPDELRRAMSSPDFARADAALRDLSEERYHRMMAAKENWIIGPVPRSADREAGLARAGGAPAAPVG